MTSHARPTPQVSLEESYRACCRLARRAAKNFYYAFWTLPRNKRRSMCALYAFFRRTDDLGDEPVQGSGFRVQGEWEQLKAAERLAREKAEGGSPPCVQGSNEARRAALRAWRASLRRAMAGMFDDPLLPAVVDTIRRYAIPVEYLETAIDGVESDLDRTTFATFDELAEYCYQVASVVGLSCVHVWGFSPDATAYDAAHQCGVAFQMTNILRDVAEDAARGRIYLPQEDLTRFGVTAEGIRAGVVNNAWRALMQFEADRIATYYQRARELTPYLEPDGVRIYGAMTDIYHGVFQEIRRRDGDVFSSRARISTWRKLGILFYHCRPWRRLGAPRAACEAANSRSGGAGGPGKPIDRAPVRGGAG